MPEALRPSAHRELGCWRIANRQIKPASPRSTNRPSLLRRRDRPKRSGAFQWDAGDSIGGQFHRVLVGADQPTFGSESGERLRPLLKFDSGLSFERVVVG